MLSPLMLVRARYVIPFTDVLTAAGAPADRLLQTAGLSREVAASPDSVIAQAHLWKFVALAAQSESRDLGMRAAQAPLHKLGPFGLSLLSAATLREALQRFCTGAAEEATARFFVADGGGQTWFCRNRIPGEEDAVAQIEQYLAVLMVNTVSGILGPQWRPSRVRLQARAPSPLATWGSLADARIECGCNHLAIGIPTALLSTRPSRPGPGGLQSQPRRHVLPRDDKPSSLCGLDALTSLRTLLKSAICHGTPGIDTVASAAGTSRRTLQRQLSAHGTSFSQELSAARFELAADILAGDPNTRLTDLAYELGYSHPAHFTRAFSRYTGVAPSRYLKALELSRDGSHRPRI